MPAPMKRSVDRLGLLIYSSDSYATCFTAGAESRVPLLLEVHRLPLKIPLRLRCGPVYICCRVITTREAEGSRQKAVGSRQWAVGSRRKVESKKAVGGM